MGIGQISIPLSLDKLEWLDFMSRNWLVSCSAGQGQMWLWFQDQSVFLSLALDSRAGRVSLAGPFTLHSELVSNSGTEILPIPTLKTSTLDSSTPKKPYINTVPVWGCHFPPWQR